MRTTDTDLVLDLEQLRCVTLEDPKLMRDILWALIEDTDKQAVLLDAALRQRDSPRAVRLARNAARACVHVGAHRTAGALRSIERGAAHDDAAACAAAMSSLQVEVLSLRSEAARF